MAKQPNVIVCQCDELRAFEVGCYGNKVIRTPHIDALAADGLRFETACPNNPVCTPSRSILISGQYCRTCTGTLGNQADTPPSRERVRLKDTTIPEAFRAAGYHTALIGKWHVHPHPNAVGFAESCFPHHSHRHTRQTFFDDWGEGYEAPGFAPEFERDRVAKFFEKRKAGGQPFFLYYNISPPHMPVGDAPEKYLTMYKPGEVLLRENAFKEGQMAYDEHYFKIYLWDFVYYRNHEPHTEKLPAGFDLRALTALYYGATSWVDDLVGAMMRNLRACGLADDTIVVFTSDHGDNLGSHGLFGKSELTEESIRVPMIFAGPGVPKGKVNREQVMSIVDLMPTLLGAAGVRVPECVQGVDRSAILRGEAQTVGESAAYIETSRGCIGIRTPTHTYGIQMDPAENRLDRRTVKDERYQFWDNRSDPWQRNNLAKTDEQADLAADLHERVLAFHRRTPAMAPLE